MKLTLTLEDKKWDWLLTKTEQDEAVAEQNVLDKVNEYLDACGRDVGADDVAKVMAALSDPVKLAAAKSAVGL